MANAQLHLDFVRNKHGGLSLVLDGHKFVQVKSRRDERTYWTCAVRDCSSRATTRDGILIRADRNHAHEADRFLVETNRVMTNIKKRCRDETTPIPNIYREEISSLRTREWNDDTATMIQQIPTYDGCKSQLYRERSKVRPALPKARHEIQLEGEWTQTTTGERFLLLDEGGEQRFIVYATDRNLQNLCQSNTIYGDGTFYTCPGQFYQLYTWHTFVDGHMYPQLFAFLPGKTEAVYTRLFQAVQRECTRLGLHLEPDILFMDHEKAPKNAASVVFPTTNVKACFFHYTQCIWRKVQSLGLTNAYRTDEDIHRLVRRAAVLPLVPSEVIEDLWFTALTDVGDLELPRAVENFTDYVTEHWVEGEKETWNHYHTLGPRTTNHVEGWHSMMKRAIKHPHPNIYNVIRAIQEVESISCVRQLQYAAGGTRPTKRRKYRHIDERLASLKQRLQDETLTLTQYADAASFLIHL